MHTPRLCIDARAARQFSVHGMVAQEVVDQLVSAQGESTASSEWIEKCRTVLISHPKQVFAGQLRRFDTRRRIGSSPLYWFWERHLLKSAGISAFHRFRPVDYLTPISSHPTVTTVLPPKGGLPFFVPRRGDQRFVVPSMADARLLEKQFHVPGERIHVIRPGVRRYVHFTPAPKAGDGGWILFLCGGKSDSAELKRLMSVVTTRFPNLPRKTLFLKNRLDLSPTSWMKLLANTRLFVYLTRQPFDWATLPLEAVHWKVPTIFPDNHHALDELLPQSSLKLSRFLVELPDFPALMKMTEEARGQLAARGTFEPLAAAKQYREIYARIPLLYDA